MPSPTKEDYAKNWLKHLGEDRDWFIGWVCFGNAPTHDAELAVRWKKCVEKLSPREVEECQVLSHGNTLDVMQGRDAARKYIDSGFDCVRRKYEESDVPLVVEK